MTDAVATHSRGQSDSDQQEGQRPLLSVEGLEKDYGGVRALDGVSFDIGRGEIVGMLGPNGAGKTTCIKSILGLVEPTDGAVRIAGHDATSDRRGVNRHVGAMLEGARNLYWRLTVRENLAFFAGLAGNDPDAVRDRHDDLLSRFGLEAKADEPVRTLSRGQQQKAALATTLARDVDIVFLDEPTLGLDVEAAVDLQHELTEIADQEDVTIVLSSHDMDVIQTVCERVIILSGGEVVVDDAVSSLLDVFRSQQYEVVVDANRPDLETALAPEFDLRTCDPLGEGTRLDVSLTDGSRIADLTQAVLDTGAEIQAVNTVEPDLEEVFLRVTEDDR